jgi:hypothetical protein
MAGLVPAIHDLSRGTKNVDARDKPGHDEFVAGMPTKTIRTYDCPPIRRVSAEGCFLTQSRCNKFRKPV